MIKTLTTKFKTNARLEGLNFFLSCDLGVKKVEPIKGKILFNEKLKSYICEDK